MIDKDVSKGHQRILLVRGRRVELLGQCACSRALFMAYTERVSCSSW